MKAAEPDIKPKPKPPSPRQTLPPKPKKKKLFFKMPIIKPYKPEEKNPIPLSKSISIPKPKPIQELEPKPKKRSNFAIFMNDVADKSKVDIE